MVAILAAVLVDGLLAVEAACAEAFGNDRVELHQNRFGGDVRLAPIARAEVSLQPGELRPVVCGKFRYFSLLKAIGAPWKVKTRTL
ncbi:hypothetical protein KKP04_15160 [Rhodomicrobium sp. Az07]|nr:hypothetical protein [Rhodomicrobium sp. Az07]MBT3072191.1 hypothetical protein [Rhodomicrobium sp. Az07]